MRIEVVAEVHPRVAAAAVERVAAVDSACSFSFV
jgi:hypothetical protein